MITNPPRALLTSLLEVELKKGGAEIEVTDENKEEYVELKSNYIMHGRMAKERQALLNAFNEVVDLRDLATVDPQVSAGGLTLTLTPHSNPTTLHSNSDPNGSG